MECKRRKPAILSLHSEEDCPSKLQHCCREKKMKVWIKHLMYRNLWIALDCFFSFLQKSENLNISLLLMLYARNPYPQNGNICYCFYFLGIRSFKKLLHSVGMQLYNIFHPQINHLNSGYLLIPSTSQSSFGSFLHKSTWHNILTRSRDAHSDMK